MREEMSDAASLVLVAVAQSVIPKLLYKYRDLSKLDRVLDIIDNSQLYFSSPSAFNDPFDCNLSWDDSYTPEQFASYLYNQQSVRLTEQEIQSIISAQIDQDLIAQMLREERRKAINSKGVLSLAKHYNNILMWSHYCNYHTGLVFGFDITEDPEFFSIPINIRYVDSYDPLKFFENRNQSTINNISMKHSNWSYEEEVRIYKSTVGVSVFNKSALKKIYFGCNAKPEHIELIKEKCLHNGYIVSFKKAKMSYGRFELEFEDC